MTHKTGMLFKRFAALLGLLVISLALFACKEEQIPEDSSTPTLTTADSQAAPTEDTVPESTQEQPQVYWIFAEGGLRVRSGPGTGFEMVGSLEEGDWVTPTRWENGWAYIEEPVAGWCSGDYLHKLGWFKDVKTPEGRELQDASLKGKWVHLTQPAEVNGETVSRAGIFRLRSNGTFIHRVADYRQNAQGKWECISLAAESYWVGEYQYDGKNLVLDYMARLEVTYDKAGNAVTREWVEAVTTVKLEAQLSSDKQSVSVADGALIPLNNSFGTDATTLKTLCKGSSQVGTPTDVAQILGKLYP